MAHHGGTHHRKQPPDRIARLRPDADPVPRAEAVELDVLVRFAVLVVRVAARDGVVGPDHFEGFAVSCRPGAKC